MKRRPPKKDFSLFFAVLVKLQLLHLAAAQSGFSFLVVLCAIMDCNGILSPKNYYAPEVDMLDGLDFH